MVHGQYQAKRPFTVLAGSYGHPIHPLLVTVPIGAWVTSLVFDIASYQVAAPRFLTEGAAWLIVVGLAGAVAAACAGFLDLFAIPAGTPAYRSALLHMNLNVAVTLAYVGGFLWRYHTYHRPGHILPGQLTLSAVSLAVLAASGYIGGKLAFHYGVRVADEHTQGEGYIPDRGETWPATDAGRR